MQKRHTIVTIICIVIIGVLAATAVTIYKSDNDRAYFAHLREVAQQKINNDVRNATVQYEQAKIKTECTKETTYYNSLNTKQKATVAAPNCDLQIVE
jgi:cytochrome c-type biogenesis protein CcmE